MYSVEFKRGGEEYKADGYMERNYTIYDECRNIQYYELYFRALLYKKVKGIFFRRWRQVACADYDRHKVNGAIKQTMDRFIEDYFERNKEE